MANPPAATLPLEPLLRTLAPALRQLERRLRAWLDGPHRAPVGTITRAALEGLAADLDRKAAALDVDRPLLVVMLMGGTGVGKSTLLNALAGGPIAQASFARPTTRDPVVYYHESIKPDRLDPALRHCRLVPHDRPGLEQKILVDTPDLDSNDLANREKLQALLPVADVVLYVGSQEKYHDRLGWELFLEQRRRRAFAFVLNKWDRCRQDGAGGLRPDEDLLRDLRAEGFHSPLLFRTCAQLWVERSGNGTPPVPEGEQFAELENWLEAGLTRLEVEAIKARGVLQLLQELEQALGRAMPPDLSDEARRVRAAWERSLDEEAAAVAEVLVNTLAPYQREIEHHFVVESQRRFRGLMAGYLSLVTRMKYAGNTLRDRLPFLPRPAQPVEAPASWDVAAFTRACSRAAGERQLDARGRALANRLQVEADRHGMPVDLLAGPVEAATGQDWRLRYAQALIEVLEEVERQWSQPTGMRRWVQTLVVRLADWAPVVTLFAVIAIKLWQVIDRGAPLGMDAILLPVFSVLAVLILLHVIIAITMPLRWPAIRGEFLNRLERRVARDLHAAYASLPQEAADTLRAERDQARRLVAEAREVAQWLAEREQAASIAGLYGSPRA